MRSYAEVTQVGELIQAGLNDCEIARLTGIPRPTVRDWRVAERWVSGRSKRALQPPSPCCGECRSDETLGAPYAYLLGLYLGDGCLSRAQRGVYKLRIVLDDRYPGIISECLTAMKQVLADNRPGTQHLQNARAIEAWVYSKHLPCLFPQHAAGRKHERDIRLADWQAVLAMRHPAHLVRGLIHSDGCRSLNTVRHGGKTYAYPRYTFSNRSDDIKRIFCDACDLLGIEWRVMNKWNISVARRESVARLDEFVGPKA